MIESSTEYRTDLVKSLYLRFLERQADSVGLPYFVNLLGTGSTVEQVEAAMVGTTEFFQDHGSTNDGFLQALYQDVLGRLPDAEGLAYFDQGFAGGLSRGTLAGLLFGSSEYQNDLASTDFSTVLGRDAGTGLPFFTGELQKGMTDQAVLAQILGSGESYTIRS